MARGNKVIKFKRYYSNSFCRCGKFLGIISLLVDFYSVCIIFVVHNRRFRRDSGPFAKAVKRGFAEHGSSLDFDEVN